MTNIAQKEINVISPLDGVKIGSINLNTAEDLNKMVAKGKEAFQSWQALTLRDRAQVMYKYRELLIQNIEELSELFTISELNYFQIFR